MRSKIIVVFFTGFISLMGLVTLMNIMRDTTVIFDSYSSFSNSANSYIDNHFAWKYSWIDVNGGFCKLLGQRYCKDEEADVYKLDNGMLTYACPRISDKSINEYTQNIIALRNETDDVPFLYIQIPYKIEKDSCIMPPGTTDYANDNADRLLYELEQAGIDTLDLREKLQSDNAWDKLFYATDQHWTTNASLHAAEIIGRELKARYGWQIDSSVYDIGSYKEEEYSEWFLGSLGKKTGTLFAGLDDYSLLVPLNRAEYEFTAWTKNGKIQRSGDFGDAYIIQDNLKKQPYTVNTYETYSGGNYKKTVSHSKEASNQKKVLLFRDSFSCTLLPFLSRSISDITTVDLRFADGDILKNLLSESWDAVLIAYNPSVFGRKCFAFTKGLER